jgi:glutathione S-transferase
MLCSAPFAAERVVPVGGLGKANAALKHLSPSGLVPCLHVSVFVLQVICDSHDGASYEWCMQVTGAGVGGSTLNVWESVAIIEFLHESHPGAGT